jgi:hypothetical protein
MRVTRDATPFNPVSIVLESRDEVHSMIDALDRASSTGSIGQDLFDFIEDLRNTVNILISAPAQIDVKTDYQVKHVPDKVRRSGN